MAIPRKSVLYQQLKTAQEMGLPIKFEKAYVSYTEQELELLVQQYLGDTYGDTPDIAPELATPAAEVPPLGRIQAKVGQTLGLPGRLQSGAATATDDRPPRLTWGQYSPETLASKLHIPFQDRGAERAGLTFNTHGPDDPIRVDHLGRVWFADEVMQPAIPKPRMRRKVTSMSSNVVTEERRDSSGHLEERFEVAGQEQHQIEIKITLPSSQVGIYVDPRLPFKVHQYNGTRAFDHEEVRDYYGGLDLIPSGIQNKTVYVGRDLCFDINAVRNTMERELRDRQLGRSEYND